MQERKRNIQAQRVAEQKEKQRLYYVERNIMQEARYEQHGQRQLEAELGGLTGTAALDAIAARLEGA